MVVDENAKLINRRRFLKRTGWVAAGVTVTGLGAFQGARKLISSLPTLTGPNLEDSVIWVQALPNGRIQFLAPRMEMGQGTAVGLAQIVAEELNVTQHDIDCILPDTDQLPPFQLTVGSQGIANFFDPVSWGAAQLREALRSLASGKTGLPKKQLRDTKAGFYLPDGSVLTYADLTADTPLIVPVEDLQSSNDLRRYALNPRNGFQAIGKNWRHHDIEAIITGKMTYARDVALPDMAFGAVIYPPAFGAKLLSVNVTACTSIPGVIGVETQKGNDFVGVVTNNPFVLDQAVEALDAQWKITAPLEQVQIDVSMDVKKHRSEDNFTHILASSGNDDTAQLSAAHRVESYYETPFAAHAAIEPRSGLVWVKDKKVEVWTGTQDPFWVQRRVAKITGRQVKDVVVHTHRIGGGFGGRVPCQASEAAARLSAVFKRPVRVQWSREMEFQNNYYQPRFSHAIDAGVTENGKIGHWNHDVVSSAILTGLAPNFVGKVIDKLRADDGTTRGLIPPYETKSQHIRFSSVRTPVPINAWRGLGAAPNAFAIESMMDELAAQAGINPLEFRLNNLTENHDRLANVLRRVAELSDWGQTRSGKTAKDRSVGRGLACSVYKGETSAAVVAEVEINHLARELQVTHVWCAQDAGLLINPHQVESQIEGNIIWGCSMALREQITIANGAVEQANFYSYDPLRHASAPTIALELVVPLHTAASAVGEAALPPVPAAIANAVFAATGRRIRQLPITYEGIFARDS